MYDVSCGGTGYKAELRHRPVQHTAALLWILPPCLHPRNPNAVFGRVVLNSSTVVLDFVKCLGPLDH